jgi:excisionase family DNA binding protein
MDTLYAAPVTVNALEQDTDEIKHLEQLFCKTATYPKLVDAHGKEIPLPDSVYEALKAVVRAMASGKAISLVPTDHELTTQKAADLLNVSRPYFIKLIEQGEIPYFMLGTHRRVKLQDVMKYRQKRDAVRHQNLKDLTEFLQDEGFYDYDKEEADCV